jgi:hypothetical protein
MKKTYATPAVVSSGGVVANTMDPGGTPSEANGHSVAGALGFYL